MNNLNQYEIWIADLDPAESTEPGKTRPVVIIQSNLLNWERHPSTVVCSISSQNKKTLSFLRINVGPDEYNGLVKPSYVLCDQIRAVDNFRLKEKIGQLGTGDIQRLQKTLRTVLSLY